MRHLTRRAVLGGAPLAFGAIAGPKRLVADSVAEFYRGKTLSLVIGLAPAGAGPLTNLYRGEARTVAFGPSAGDDYDTRGRLLARHMGRYIPGQPEIVPRNMPGAGGVIAANWLARQAPRDGTALLMLSQGIPVIQTIGVYGVELDVGRCNWIGNTFDNPNVMTAWHGSGIRTIADAMERELIVGATWRGSETYCYPAAINALLGTKFKIVLGYADDIDLNIAMERGEIAGRVNSWAAWKAKRPAWIVENKIHNLVQSGLWRHPELPDVPLMSELAQNNDDRQVLNFLSADSAIARSVVTAAETPPVRVTALRQALNNTMRDPEFLAQADKAQVGISPVPGEKAQQIAELIVNTPPSAVARAKAFFQQARK